METETELQVLTVEKGSDMSGPGRLAIGSAIFIFAVGSIFWAGATYDRIGSIEKQLTNLDQKLSIIEVVPVLQHDAADHERRIQKLEDYLRKNP